jgi:hypothetical protein
MNKKNFVNIAYAIFYEGRIGTEPEEPEEPREEPAPIEETDPMNFSASTPAASVIGIGSLIGTVIAVIVVVLIKANKNRNVAQYK